MFCKNVFSKTSQNSLENTCPRVSFFNKVAYLRPATLLKKSLWDRCFPVHFAKFLRTPTFTETHTDQSILQVVLLCLKRKTTYKPSKAATAKKGFCSLYVIGTICFNECLFFIPWKTLLLIKVYRHSLFSTDFL